MRNRALIPLILAAVALIAVEPAVGAEPDKVRVDVEVYRVLGDFSGDLSLTDDIWSHINSPSLETKRAFTFFTMGKANLADVHLTVDQHGWHWTDSQNKAIHTTEEKGAKAPGDRVMLLAHPTTLVPVGSSASIQIAAEQNVEYFQRLRDNVFELKTMEQPTGLSLSMGVERIEKGRILLKDFTITSRIVEARKPIDGVTLNVGEPILKTREFKASMNLQPGRDYGILMHAKDSQGLLLIRLRVDEVQKPDASVPSKSE